MTTTNPTDPPAGGPEAENHFTGLFTALVMQNTNLALTFLGRAPNPETGETTLDLQTAELFIDTLEMLSAKTKGNLTKPESDLLNRNLTYLRLAFVESVESGPKAPEQPTPTLDATAAQETAPSANAPDETAPPATPPTPEAPAEDSRKKFVKRY